MHELADDANENHNYIACLFILQLLSWKKLKKLLKLSFVLSLNDGLKLNFQGNWKEMRKDETS